ncbi:hypothetical protein QTP88_018053 [Uroleucon formosanum]
MTTVERHRGARDAKRTKTIVFRACKNSSVSADCFAFAYHLGRRWRHANPVGAVERLTDRLKVVARGLRGRRGRHALRPCTTFNHHHHTVASSLHLCKGRIQVFYPSFVWSVY